MYFNFRIFSRLLWLGTFGGKNFRLKRAATTVVILMFFAILTVCWTIGSILDRVFFPSLRYSKVKAPLFIIGNPRSGTTHLHYLLSLDEERFFYVRLWQTLFPAVTQQRLISTLCTIDRVLFRATGKWLFSNLESWAFRGWDGIHKVRLDRPEECVAVWCLACNTPSAYLLMPFIDQLPEVKYVDRLSQRSQQRLMNFYHEVLNRQLYVSGGNRTYLGKNVFHTGRLKALLEEFPEARFVHLVRHPYEEIPSMVSMFTKPWQFHSPEISKTSSRAVSASVFTDTHTPRRG